MTLHLSTIWSIINEVSLNKRELFTINSKIISKYCIPVMKARLVLSCKRKAIFLSILYYNLPWTCSKHMIPKAQKILDSTKGQTWFPTYSYKVKRWHWMTIQFCLFDVVLNLVLVFFFCIATNPRLDKH